MTQIIASEEKSFGAFIVSNGLMKQHPDVCKRVKEEKSNMSKTYSVALLETMGMPEEMIDFFENLKAKGKWSAMSAYMSCYSEWMAVTFEAYYDSVPDNERYKFLIDLYSDGGDRIGSIRKAMRTARKYGSPVLPPDLGDIITVYRAGDESINKAPYRLSWTTDLEKAKWFMEACTARKRLPPSGRRTLSL